MGKTQWQEETHHLTPDLMIGFFGNNAETGHDHNGTDDDGSCPKIVTEGTVNVDVTSTYFTTPVNADWTYVKLRNMISILIPAMFGQHVSNTELQFTPHTTWPSIMVPKIAQYIPVLLFTNDGGGEERIGRLYISALDSDNISANISNATSKLVNNGFGTGGNKGIFQQTITYYVD